MTTVELPNLPSCRELHQRRAREYASAILQAKMVYHFARIGPRAAFYVNSRVTPGVVYATSSARRLSLAERMFQSFWGVAV
jgi:hypothetical protein